MIDAIDPRKFLKRIGEKKLKAKKESDVSVIVGYETNYALYVHEMTPVTLGKGVPRQKPHKGMYWDPQGRGQNKFLEQPAREHAKRVGDIVRQVYEKSGSLFFALWTGGGFIQRMSMKLVPVDTGDLKGSAFTRKG